MKANTPFGKITLHRKPTTYIKLLDGTQSLLLQRKPADSASPVTSQSSLTTDDDRDGKQKPDELMPPIQLPLKFLRLPDVLSLIGMRKSWLYLRVKKGTFPKPIHYKVGSGSGSAVWRSDEVLSWMESQIKLSRVN